MKEMTHVFLFAFFHCRSFSPWFFFQRNSSPTFFISHSSSFSVIHVSVDFNIWSKKGLGIVVVFLVAWRFTAKRAGV